jgi:hypothetical protein
LLGISKPSGSWNTVISGRRFEAFFRPGVVVNWSG